MLKRILITTVIFAGIFGTYWSYGFLSMDNARSAGIVSFTDDFCLAGFKNKSGWLTYSEEKMADGIWYGGIAKNNTIVSAAQSSTLSTRTYTRNGAWDHKHWSGWSQPGEKSCVKRSNSFGRAGALAMGTWYGYDAK